MTEMTEKATIKKVTKAENIYELKMTITKGKVFALFNALDAWSVSSPIARDLKDLLLRAADSAHINFR